MMRKLPPPCRITKQAAVLLALLGALISCAQATEVIIDDLNHKLSQDEIATLKHIAQDLCDFHRQHLELPETIRIPVRIFSSDKHYAAYRNRISMTAQSNSGFYSDVKKEIVVNAGQDPVRIIAHELQHFILRLDFRHDIKWLDEGLAEYFEYAFPDRHKTLIREQPQKRKRLQDWLQQQSLPSLAEFLNWSNSRWQQANHKPPHQSRSLAWGLIYFLMSNDQGRKALSSTINRLRHNPAEKPAAALAASYPGGLDVLEADFHTFLNDVPSTVHF